MNSNKFNLFRSLSLHRGFLSISMAGRSNPAINPELVVAHEFPEANFPYTERDAALYALGVGACGRDAVDANELKYVYHSDGQQFIKVLPTFPALFPLGSLPELSRMPGMEFDPRLLLHGQQYIEIYKPLAANNRIRNKARIAGLHDKGKAAIVEIETTSYDDSGEPLCMNRTSVFEGRRWLFKVLSSLFLHKLFG